MDAQKSKPPILLEEKTQNHLISVSRLSRVVAIFGFIATGVATIGFIVALSVLFTRNENIILLVDTLPFILIIIAFCCLFYFLYTSSVKLKSAIAGNDDKLLEEAFLKMKLFWKWVIYAICGAFLCCIAVGIISAISLIYTVLK